jgi:hypothetical protein
MAKPKWEPSKHASGKWRVAIPAKLSETGRRRDKYFKTRKSAEEFIAETLGEREEHGKQAVSSGERHWIAVVRTELGSLGKLRDVLDHWARTGRGVQQISATEAVELFIKDQYTAGLNPKMMDDIRSRLRAFGKEFGDTPLHQNHAWNGRGVHQRSHRRVVSQILRQTFAAVLRLCSPATVVTREPDE